MNLNDLHESISKEFEPLYKEEKASSTRGGAPSKEETPKPRFKS